MRSTKLLKELKFKNRKFIDEYGNHLVDPAYTDESKAIKHNHSVAISI